MYYGPMTPGGSPTPVPSFVDENADVLFIDYDGTPLYGFTKEEALALTELPEPMDHSKDDIPLTFEGWNYTLEELVECVQIMNVATVGAMYHTTDGLTHIGIRQLKDNEVDGVRIYCTTISGAESQIDWGDGTVEPTVSGANLHTYESGGNYDVKISNASSVWVGTTTAGDGYCRKLTYMKLADTITKFETYAFSGAYHLESISITSSVTTPTSWSYFISGCRCLKGLVVPPNVTSASAFAEYISVSIRISLPPRFVSIGTYAFSNSFIRRIDIPHKVQGTIGNYAFSVNTGIYRLIIPPKVTKIGTSTFDGNTLLRILEMKGATPPSVARSTYLPTGLDKLVVPKGRLETYQSATNWSTLASKMEEADE